MKLDLTNLQIGDRVRYFLGPKKLPREGTVLDINYSTGKLTVRVDGTKTNPVRTVDSSCQPVKL